MSRMHKNHERKEPFRDARLILIAVEGICTEKLYFELLSQSHKNSKIKVNIVKRYNTDSSPKHIFNNLIKQLANYNNKLPDEIYMVIDRDAWTSKMMDEVQKQCFEKGFYFIVSNPNFELWLLLHINDVSSFTNEEKILIKNNKRISRAKNAKKYIEKLLSDKTGGFNKTKASSIIKFIPKVETAIKNAVKLNPPPPEKRGCSIEIGTQVHFLVKEIIQKI